MTAPRLRVAVDTPQHAGLEGALSYSSERTLAPGTLVRVPLGRRQVAGIVWPGEADAELPAQELRPVGQVLDALPPLGAAWMQLVAFAAAYYQRGLGELALAVLPPELRRLDAAQLAASLLRLRRRLDNQA
jgi:primosomal protein N' (replication factor Y)